MQAAEVDQLKAKIKQYADYDEIKRELEIMKVCSLTRVIPSPDADVMGHSTSSLLAWTVMTTQKTM